MQHKSIFILFMTIFLIGCTSLYGADLQQGSSKRGIQLDFSYDFPNRGTFHNVRERDFVQVAFNLINHGDYQTAGTLQVSEDFNYLNDIIPFNLGGIQRAERATRGTSATKPTQPIFFPAYQYTKDIFDNNLESKIRIQLDYDYQTKLIGDFCVVSLIASSRSTGTCRVKETINEAKLDGSGIYPVSVEKIEKKTIQLGQDSYRVIMDIHLRDYGPDSSFIVGNLNNFNLELRSGSRAQCEGIPVKFEKKSGIVTCNFLVAASQDLTKVPFTITFSYPYRVNKVYDIKFQK